MLRFDRKQQNSVKQLSFNKNITKKKKRIHPAIWETWVDPWVGKIPWRRESLTTVVFWPGEFYGLYSPCGLKELGTTE